MRFKPKKRYPRGFSLIVTISMMVLLSLLAVGMLGLSTISLRSSTRLDAYSRAQANARLGLMIALGDLQKYLGPDQRASARAETLARDPRVQAKVDPNTPQAWWVGVSHSDRDETLGDSDRSVVWLVSGLDSESGPGSQLGASFETAPLEPVPMFTANSLDVDRWTGGQPIVAGRVPVSDDSGDTNGAFAYFVDDNGMKAQLAASNSRVRNDLPRPLGGGVLPGSYDLGVLAGMKALEGTDLEQYSRLGSIRDLPFLGGESEIARDKMFSYTTHSQGVLADVRKGGLKRDLTIAFEHDDVFAKVFPRGSDGFDPRYIAMDEEKFSSQSDLQENGYIHFEVFKDYYNIKKYIRSSDAGEVLAPVFFSKDEIFSDFDTPFGRGELGPHAIGGSGTPSRHRQLPYGNFPTLTRGSGSNSQHYKHSPVGPILSRMQQNAWIDVETPAPPFFGRPRLKTNVQLWASHYNPYNIGLKVEGDAPDRGPRIIAYPQVRFTLPGYLDRKNGLGNKRESHVPHAVLLGPGRSHVCAFRSSGQISSENDLGLYDDQVRDRTLDSIYSYKDLSRPPGGQLRMEIEFYLEKPSMSHGADDEEDQFELSQVFWAPFAWDKVEGFGEVTGDFPGKKVVKTVGANELNENAMVSHSFHLRTTREGGNSLRPLVDANLRAILCNSKWDGELGLPILAAYSPENAGEVDEPFFPMDTRDAPRGYSYWGSDRSPVDGYDRVILFDIPRRDLVSLGQLQHAGAGRFSYEPTYIAGNSYANPRLPLDQWVTTASDTLSSSDNGLAPYAIPGSFNLYDASYLVNEELFDSYIFTTIPQVRDDYRGEEPSYGSAYFKDLLAGTASLANPRFIPYEPDGSNWDQDTLQDRGDGQGSTGGFFHNAGHLLVDGAFNVNSTSVDAWEAFLSGTYRLPVGQLTPNGAVSGFQPASEGVRFPRVQAMIGDGAEGGRMDESFWTGFRELTSEEVRELAEAIVEQIRERGPFLTLGEFVNRKLEDSPMGASGALQAALDLTVNEGVDSDFGDEARHSALPGDSKQAAGFPGYLLQGDVLQALSPYMTPRSDSFTIRAYGEARNASSGELEARAWCEAVVQRFPDACPDTNAGDVLEELAMPSSRFGRQFRIVSFRWLSAEEV